MEHASIDQYKIRVKSIIKTFNKSLNDYLSSFLTNDFKKAVEKFFIDERAKRLRPLLTILTYQSLTGKEDVPEIMPIAAALEIIHNTSLMIDDIFDKDIKRRGKKAFYVEYGTFAALSIAFYLATIASEIILKARSLGAIEVLTRSTRDLSLSLYLSSKEQGSKLLSLDDIFLILDKKTTTLFKACTWAPAKLANTSAEKEEKIASIGWYFGRAYQLRDDLLGVIGEPKVLGKHPVSDITNRLQTYIFHQAYKKASAEQREILAAH